MRIFVFLLVLLSMPQLQAADWLYRFGNPSLRTEFHNNAGFELNGHFCFVRRIDNQSFAVERISKKAKRLQSVVFSGTAEDYFQVAGMALVDGRILVYGSVIRYDNFVPDYNGFYLELDSCLAPVRYEELFAGVHQKVNSVQAILKYKAEQITMVFNYHSVQNESTDAILSFQNDTIQKAVCLKHGIEFSVQHKDQFHFLGYNASPQIQAIGNYTFLLSTNQDLEAISYTHFLSKDSFTSNSSGAISVLNNNRFVIGLNDNPFTGTPGIESNGNIIIIDGSCRRVQQSLMAFTDPGFNESVSAQLTDARGRIYTFTNRGNGGFKPPYGYIHNAALQPLAVKKLSFYNCLPLSAFWDSDSNIVLYGSYSNFSGINPIVFRLNQLLDPVEINDSLSDLPFCNSGAGNYRLTTANVRNLIVPEGRYLENDLNNACSDAASFRLYPNPFSGTLHCDYEGSMAYRIALIDVCGKHVFRSDLQHASVSLDTGLLNGGIYMVLICDEQGQILQAQKMIKL